jgi:translin
MKPDSEKSEKSRLHGIELEEAFEKIRLKLTELDSAREDILKLTREMRRYSTSAIAYIHTGDVNRAEKSLNDALEILEKVNEYRDAPEIYYPLTRDSMQELVEAISFFEVVRTGELRLPDLDVQLSSVLTGIADMAGELRRYTLDLLRMEKFEDAEKMLGMMEKIYFNLITFSFPDKLVPGLKSKLDMLRFAIERTKSDFIAAKVASLKLNK